MSSLLRHTPEGFRKEYLSKCSQRFEQKGGSTTTHTNLGLFEEVDYQPVTTQVFPPSFYERYNGNKHNEILAKLAGEGKIDELHKEMVKLGVVYYASYLKKYAGHRSTLLCLNWAFTASNTNYQAAHGASGTPPTEDAFFAALPGPGALSGILQDILNGNTYKTSPATITQTEVYALSLAVTTDLGKLALLAYMEWPSMANDATKYETDATLLDIDEIFKDSDLALIAAANAAAAAAAAAATPPGDAARDAAAVRAAIIAGMTSRMRTDTVALVLGWFAGPNNLNDKVLTNALAPPSFGSHYIQAAINALPYDEFFKVGKYDAMKNLLNEHRQKYMTTPSTPTGTYLPVPVFINVGHTGGGKEDPFFFFSSNAMDIMKGVKLYLAGKKKQAFSPESEKQIMSAISNVGKHEKEYFAKIQEVNSQRYGSKYSMEEKQAMVDTIGKTLTLKINRLKDLINSVVTQAIA